MTNYDVIIFTLSFNRLLALAKKKKILNAIK